MCIGLTIMIVPPSVLGVSYVMFTSGQSWVQHRYYSPSSILRLSSSSASASVPTGSILSYASGIATAAGLYHVQSTVIARYEPKSSIMVPTASATTNIPARRTTTAGDSFIPPHKATQPFRPPQTVNELYQALGRPFLTRLAAASVSFFCAGAVQAYVAGARPSQQQQHDG